MTPGIALLEVLLKPVAPFGGMWQTIVVKFVAGIALVGDSFRSRAWFMALAS